MAESDYWNFDLTISPHPQGGYKIDAKGPEDEGGEGSERINWDFTEPQITEWRALVEGPARDAKRTVQTIGGSKPDYRKVMQFGERLFDAVFVGRVKTVFITSLTLAKTERDKQGGRPFGLRIRLHLRDVPEIADVPWEYLYNRDSLRYLALRQETPIVRYIEITERIPAFPLPSLPIRVLVVIADPTDMPGLDGPRETANIEEAFSELKAQGLADVKIIEKVTLERLREHLEAPNVYHVLHFIGHGGFVPGVAPGTDEGVLLFRADDGKKHEVTGEVLLSQLDHPSLRLVVLNSCEGAQSGAHDPFAGMAQRLAQGDIPATIAMQFRITDKAAITFAATFYEKLARGYTIDKALVDTRIKLFAQNPTEWGTPVLFTRAGDGRLFDLPTEEQMRLRRIEALEADAKAAIDRKDYLGAMQKLQEIQKLLQPAAPGN